MKHIYRIAGIIVFLCIISACGGSGGSSDASPEVQAAMQDAASVGKTIYFSLSSDSIEGLQGRIYTSFPGVDTLIAGGSSGRDAMLADFTGTPSFSDDVKLAIFAYALEIMGDSGSSATLKTFLGNNITSDLYFTPQFVTHAIRALSGLTDTDPFFYSPDEMRSSSGTSAASIGTPVTRAASASRLSCARMFGILDGNGSVMTYVDDSGATKEAVITGYEYTASGISDEESQMLQQGVADGGGTYVNDNAEFPGSPTERFNCAGYAFRSLNGDKRWRLDPAKTFEVLTKTGALVEVNESEARAGDKVFYFASSDSKYPGHVAEVDRIESGIISNTIIVRNGYNNTGLWEAPINASYFMGSWMPGTEDARYAARKVYRWAGGAEPVLTNDPDATTTDYCDSSNLGFSAIVDITGYSVTFVPTTVAAANNGEYIGSVYLTDVVGIAASQGSGASAAVLAMGFDRRSVSGTGPYSFNTMPNVFDTGAGSVYLAFSSPSITHADDGDQVAFESTSGSTTLTSWGTSIGDRLIGTYLANVSGTRRTNAAGQTPATQILTGVISGSFDVEIATGN